MYFQDISTNHKKNSYYLKKEFHVSHKTEAVHDKYNSVLKVYVDVTEY